MIEINDMFLHYTWRRFFIMESFSHGTFWITFMKFSLKFKMVVWHWLSVYIFILNINCCYKINCIKNIFVKIINILKVNAYKITIISLFNVNFNLYYILFFKQFSIITFNKRLKRTFWNVQCFKIKLNYSHYYGFNLVK